MCVPFDGVTDDVFGDMLRALQTGEVDAVVDDDVAFLGIERTYPDIRVAFTVATRNRWGCALRLGDDELKRRARRRHRAGRPAGRLAPAGCRRCLPALGRLRVHGWGQAPDRQLSHSSPSKYSSRGLRRTISRVERISTLSESGNSATSERTLLLIAR